MCPRNYYHRKEQKEKSQASMKAWDWNLVEVAGIEPASEMIFSSDLHV